MNSFAFSADATVYVPKVAQSFLNDHIRAADAKDARIAELEALCKSKDTRIADLETDLDFIKIRHDKEFEAFKAKIALLENELEDSIAAHAGDSTLDADKLAAQAKFAIANVEPYVRSDYEKWLFKFNKLGLVKPIYKKVDLDKKVGPGNGEVVLDRNDLKDCLAKGMPLYTMDNRAPEGIENTPENRRRTYVPYAEIEADQKEFEKRWPKFTEHKDSAFKKVSRDPRCDKRALPRGRK